MSNQQPNAENRYIQGVFWDLIRKFKPHARVTMILRDTTKPDGSGDLVMTNEDHPREAMAVLVQKSDEPRRPFTFGD